jgi:HSP20 family protein
MLSVKLNKKPFEKSFDSLIDGFWAELPSVFKHDFNEFPAKGSVPVNVKESENGYDMEVVAPGFEKKDFTVNIDQNLLTITADHNTSQDTGDKAQSGKDAKDSVEEGRVVRSEYQYRSFKRTFTIDEKIDATRIGASYINGVLLINLPKKEEIKTEAKAIEIK